jgi:hypothetical protein
MYASLAPEQQEGFYSYLVFKSSIAIGRCPVNMKAPASKILSFHIIFEKYNGDFLEKGSSISLT